MTGEGNDAVDCRRADLLICKLAISRERFENIGFYLRIRDRRGLSLRVQIDRSGQSSRRENQGFRHQYRTSF